MPDSTADKPLVLGLAGLGTVGSGLADILASNHDWITRRVGRKITIKTVLVRDANKPRAISIPGAAIVTDPAALINDPDIDVAVELMGGTHAAKSFILDAIDAGKHVVTANKALLAEHGRELFPRAAAKGAHLLYEASVAGGIPVVDTIKESLAGNRINELMGILNGTANFILTKMNDEDVDFMAALRQAQDLGFAEADPTLDVEGGDAAHKLILLIRLAFGVHYPLEKLRVTGVSVVTPMDMAFARDFGYRIKLLARARVVEGGKIEAGVFPSLIPDHYMLAKVNGSFNAVRIDGDASGTIMLYGRGAGDKPTGSAVLADIMAIARNRPPNNTGFLDTELPGADIIDLDEAVTEHYLRMRVEDRPGVLRDLGGVMADHEISLKQVIQKGEAEAETVPLVFFTHHVAARNIHAAMDAIERADFARGRPMHYRIL